MNSISMVSFDADQTLFDFHKVMMEALDETAKFFTCNDIPTSPENLRDVRDKIAESYVGKSIDMLELRRISFREISKSDGLTNQAMDLFQEIRFGRVYFYDGTIDTLKELRKANITISLITNGNSDPERAGIDEYFDHIFLGEKYPFKKPDTRIFSELLSASNKRKEDVLHVGDSLVNDVQGANDSGIISVWFNPHKTENTSNIIPKYEISHLNELLDLVS